MTENKDDMRTLSPLQTEAARILNEEGEGVHVGEGFYAHATYRDMPDEGFRAWAATFLLQFAGLGGAIPYATRLEFVSEALEKGLIKTAGGCNEEKKGSYER